jgi:hypothetical protein
MRAFKLAAATLVMVVFAMQMHGQTSLTGTQSLLARVNVIHDHHVMAPTSLQFPLAQPVDERGRIEQGVDSTLHAPTEYVWNLTYERQMRLGTTLSVSYVGRMGRSLLAGVFHASA